MRAPKLASDLLLSAATVAAITAAIGAVLSRWQAGPLAVLYILGILWLAALRGRRAALLAACEAFLVYDWFFVPPFHTLDVIDRLQPVSDGHELRLVADEREFLADVDYVQLSQVLTNLVDNAIRHGAPGAPIRVGVAKGHVWMENSGRQLSEDERARIFDRFYRGDGLAAGTELGLAIAKGVVEAHGGRIRAENLPGGVAFHVELPAAVPAASA